MCSPLTTHQFNMTPVFQTKSLVVLTYKSLRGGVGGHFKLARIKVRLLSIVFVTHLVGLHDMKLNFKNRTCCLVMERSFFIVYRSVFSWYEVFLNMSTFLEYYFHYHKLTLYKTLKIKYSGVLAQQVTSGLKPLILLPQVIVYLKAVSNPNQCRLGHFVLT